MRINSPPANSEFIMKMLVGSHKATSLVRSRTTTSGLPRNWPLATPVASDFHWTIERPNAVRRNSIIPNWKALGGGFPDWCGSRSADEKCRSSALESQCSLNTRPFSEDSDEIVKLFRQKMWILYIVRWQFIVQLIHRIFMHMVNITVRTDHFCTDNPYCPYSEWFTPQLATGRSRGQWFPLNNRKTKCSP